MVGPRSCRSAPGARLHRLLLLRYLVLTCRVCPTTHHSPVASWPEECRRKTSLSLLGEQEEVQRRHRLRPVHLPSQPGLEDSLRPGGG